MDRYAIIQALGSISLHQHILDKEVNQQHLQFLPPFPSTSTTYTKSTNQQSTNKLMAFPSGYSLKDI